MSDLIERLRTEAGRRTVKLGNSLSKGYAHREDVRAMLREAADALEAAWEDAERYRFLRAEALSAFESGLDEPQLVFARECVGDYQNCIDAATDAARETHNG